jgi:hypothetical protein
MTMAVAMLLEWPGVTLDQYDAVVRDLDLNGKTYQGGLFHVAGATDSGVRVVDVWESETAFQAFAEAKLMATLARHGVQPPQVSAWPVHNTLTPTGPVHGT